MDAVAEHFQQIPGESNQDYEGQDPNTPVKGHPFKNASPRRFEIRGFLMNESVRSHVDTSRDGRENPDLSETADFLKHEVGIRWQ